MFQTVPLVTLACECEQAIALATLFLQAAGLQVHPSFNLQQAKPAGLACTCPHASSSPCTCQMAVLLVYSQDGPYVTLIAHGNESQTRIGLVDSPQQPMNVRLANRIRMKLASPQFLTAAIAGTGWQLTGDDPSADFAHSS